MQTRALKRLDADHPRAGYEVVAAVARVADANVMLLRRRNSGGFVSGSRSAGGWTRSGTQRVCAPAKGVRAGHRDHDTVGRLIVVSWRTRDDYREEP